MRKSIASPLRGAARVVVTAALSLALTGAAVAPALAAEAASAAEAGVITKEFGRGYPTQADCEHEGILAQRREHADGYRCVPDSGKWTGYVYWYTR